MSFYQNTGLILLLKLWWSIFPHNVARCHAKFDILLITVDLTAGISILERKHTLEAIPYKFVI